MLHYGTVEPRTLDVLRRLMQLPELRDFYLVGDTALALYYDHRKSIDIDLFSTKDFSNENIAYILEQRFPGFTYSNIPNPIGIFGFVDEVKTDFVKFHQYDLIDTPIIEEDIRLLGINDLAAMKVAAILKRGVKKDFWDIS